ncbi:OmpA family protein [Sorangium sp. So ce131]|uniref:OmpA family protein n=1 Tax=Sorangium sp. So ce131 TaxID=3133282 RepID=UPI003F60374C
MADEYSSSDFVDGPGIAAHHDARPVLPLFVAPATQGEINTIRFRPIPIACARLNHAGFAFDSSFVSPEMRPALQQLGAVYDANPGAPLSVFGHADPIGDDAYNKQLSGRRATSVYALLTRRVDLWEDLYATSIGGDTWGLDVIRTMLSVLKNSDGISYLDTTSGSSYEATRAFQRDNDLADDGDPGPKTRAKLFRAYMDAVCVRGDNSPFEVPPEQFIGHGGDPNGKGAYQGCSEFNPVFLFAKADANKPAFGKTAEERNQRNGINRRALVFFFRAGTHIAVTDWPCPRVSEGDTGCKAQFWPDGDARRQPGDAEREYRRTRDTFACRYYDGFARRSPCEGVAMRTITLHLHDDAAKPVDKAHYRVTIGVEVRAGQLLGAVLTLKRVVLPADCLVEWSPPGDEKLEKRSGTARWQMTVHIDVDSGSREENAVRRLHNIGYPESEPLADNIRAFQRDQELFETGSLDDATEARLVAVHEELSAT